MKGSGFVDMMFASGIGAYAAKNSSSMKGLLFKLAKYALVVIGVLLALMVVMRLLNISVEGFVPIAPSPEGDKKVETPAGNVIMY